MADEYSTIVRADLLRQVALLSPLVLVFSCAPGGCGSGAAASPKRKSSVAGADQGKRPVAPDAVAYKGSFPAGSGHLSASLKVAGRSRKVDLFLPDRAPKNAPLLITLHGTNGEGRAMITSSAADELARSKGVVIASPWARHRTAGDWDNHTGSETYWETFPNTDPKANPDLLLLRAVIQEARRAYAINPGRVYLLGHSNGGFFAILAAMSMPERIAAFAANSSGLVRCPATAGCSFKGKGTSCDAFKKQSGYCDCRGAEKPVSIPSSTPRKVPGFLSHAADDPVVSVYYTCELGKRMASLGYPVRLAIASDGEHGMPHPLAQRTWQFLSHYALP